MSLAGCSGGAGPATWTPTYCTVVAADTSDFSYLACPACGRRALPGHPEGAPCGACGGPAPARAYRLLLSKATHDRIFPVVLFDRAARALLSCPADELARLFARTGAPRAAADALQGRCAAWRCASPPRTAPSTSAPSPSCRSATGSARSSTPSGRSTRAPAADRHA
ncbi:hypothetical protein ZWY2020_042741 [Hordeum vulgare]|nr:hypothetical protein ZWY2020_042741 [Hordeum vulgare]